MQILLLSLAVLGRVFVFGLFLIRDAVTHDVVNDARQLVGRRRDGFGCAESPLHPAEVRTQVTLAARQAQGGQAQGMSGATFPLRVRLLFTLPPVCFQFGHKRSQLVKFVPSAFTRELRVRPSVEHHRERSGVCGA